MLCAECTVGTQGAELLWENRTPACQAIKDAVGDSMDERQLLQQVQEYNYEMLTNIFVRDESPLVGASLLVMWKLADLHGNDV